MKVSVIIAAYNHEKYVERAIESVLEQTFADLEIIFTDDASSDRTFELAQRAGGARIDCVRALQNSGGSANLNQCIARASGSYLAVLNSDDFFAVDKLRRQVEILDARPQVAAVFTHATMVDENGQPDVNAVGNVFRQPNRSRHAWLRRFFFNGNCLCHPSLMIRREIYDALGTYDPRYAQLPDFDMWIRICLQHEIHVIEEPLIFFRLRASGANTNNNRPETMARIAWEFEHVIRRFLTPLSFDDFAAIFPELSLRRDEWDFAMHWRKSLSRYRIWRTAASRWSCCTNYLVNWDQMKWSGASVCR
jgi:glycosyltransferase involved in cell wall biosynthesis